MLGDKFRLRFEKAGVFRLLSHHDLMRVLERMLRRAGLPFKSTAGFHPGPRVVFAQSLPLGVVGRDEVVELELTEPRDSAAVLAGLNGEAPDGLRFTGAAVVPMKVTALPRRIVYSLPLPADRVPAAEAAAARLTAEPAVWVERVRPSPKGLNIRPYLRSVRVEVGSPEQPNPPGPPSLGGKGGDEPPTLLAPVVADEASREGTEINHPSPSGGGAGGGVETSAHPETSTSSQAPDPPSAVTPAQNIVRGQWVEEGKATRARELRREMTPTERALWDRLRSNQLGGFHFRRQQVIDGFIADFYCHAAALVVEADGAAHEGRTEYDADRDRVFAGRGLVVLRVSNDAVASQLPHVLDEIERRCRERAGRPEQPNPPGPPSLGGKGGDEPPTWPAPVVADEASREGTEIHHPSPPGGGVGGGVETQALPAARTWQPNPPGPPSLGGKGGDGAQSLLTPILANETSQE
ncbi:MAG TPA: TIGR03936 family radical SAM-associated protein, partial [Urbifossiella sp.]|nr:TIGR03936 family radical SAM-associated protein [Urbifossiella sp.]